MSNKKVYGIVGGLIAVMFTFGIGSAIRYAMSTYNSTPEMQGLTYTRDTYVSSCSYWAKLEQTSEPLPEEMINKYCGCVYDEGIKVYGKEGFVKADAELTETGVVTTQMNDLVNVCVQKAVR